MRMNNIGVGILIAVSGAAVIAIGMAVQHHMMEKEENERSGLPAVQETGQEGTNEYDTEGWPAFNSGNNAAGDINGDGTVNMNDLTFLEYYLNDNGSVAVNNVNSDINQDGTIDGGDYELLRNLFLRGRYSG